MQPYETQTVDNESSIFPERPAVYATFGQRLVASLLDGIIIYAGTFLVEHFIIDNQWGNMAFGTVVSWLYNALMLSGPNQATIGKKAMGIQVTDTQGRRISFARASGRYFATILSTIILLIGYFMMLWDNRNQTLHDKIADTIVVKQPPLVIP